MESLKKDAPTISTKEDGITFSTSTAGNHRAIRKYKGVTITCPNNSATIASGTATNMLRLVAEAIDLKWFRPNVEEIGVMGPAHSTTKIAKGETIPDAKHITVVYKPGGAQTEHLYLTPNMNDSTVSEATHLDTNKPTPYYVSMNKDKTGDKTQGTKDT